MVFPHEILISWACRKEPHWDSMFDRHAHVQESRAQNGMVLHFKQNTILLHKLMKWSFSRARWWFQISNKGCVCVCMYVCMYVYIYIYALQWLCISFLINNTYIHTYMHACMHACMHAMSLGDDSWSHVEHEAFAADRDKYSCCFVYHA